MALDLICCAIVLIFLVAGLWHGFVLQIIRLGAIVGAYMIARIIGPQLGVPVAIKLKYHPLTGNLLGTLIVWIVIYLLVSFFAGKLIHSFYRKRGKMPLWDRLCGGCLGGVKGVVLSYIIVASMILMTEVLSSVRSPFRNLYYAYHGSTFGEFVAKNNILWKIQFPVIGSLHNLRVALDNREKKKRLLKDPDVKRLLNYPRLLKLLKDDKMVEAMRKMDYETLLHSWEMLDLMNDRKFIELVEKVDFERILQGETKKK